MYQKWWRYTGQRDYAAIVQAVGVATLGMAGFVALFKPVTVASGRGEVSLAVPTGSSACSSC
jgi:hypothetical protein